MNIPEISVSLFAIIFGIYLVLLGVIYFIIFHKHHKRNKIELSELLDLVTKFYTKSMISTIFIILGIYSIIDANSYKDERSEVILRVLLGILIISITIINFIFYIKRSLKDYDLTIRAQNKKQTQKIGEILQLIIFTIFLFVPILGIPNYIEVSDNKVELLKLIFRNILIALGSLFLLYQLNPLNIKSRLKLNFKSKDENNKKTIVKDKGVICYIVITACLIIFRFYNLSVLIDYSNAMNDNNYKYIKIEQIDITENNEKSILCSELGISDKIYLSKNSFFDHDGKYTNTYIVDLNSNNEFYDTYSFNDTEIILFKDDYKKDVEILKNSIYENCSYNYLNKLKGNYENKEWLNFAKNIFFYPITIPGEYNNEKCNIIISDIYLNFLSLDYVSTDTDLLLKNEIKVDGKVHSEKIYEYKNEIPEELNKIPNINDFENVIYDDYLKQKVEDLSEPEIPISNTTLNPGERLVENVKLLSNENLNFLNLKQNSSGIINIKIENFETYNKFKEKYSNLRELSQEDFLRYRVHLIYKDGYKLNYKSSHESDRLFKINYVLESEKTDLSNILLIVEKRFDINEIILVESEKNVIIQSNDAYDIFEKNIEQIQKDLKIDDSNRMGMKIDYLGNLNTVDYLNLDYKNIPEITEEKLCWIIKSNIVTEDGNTNENVYVYIDSTNGEIIGACKKEN